MAGKLVQDHPSVSQFQETLALVYNTRANLHSDLGQFAEGQECAHQAVAAQGKVLRAEPANLRSLWTFTQFEQTRGFIALKRGDPATAQEAYASSVAGLEKLVREQPGNKDYQRSLGAARTSLTTSRKLGPVGRRLTAFLDGEAEPRGAAERLDMAYFCQLPGKRLHATAARLAADAFTAAPRAAADLQQQYRYRAACSAVLAAAGQAEDARLVPDKLALKLRRQALRWLHADLAVYTRLAQRPDPRARAAVRQRLTHW